MSEPTTRVLISELEDALRLVAELEAENARLLEALRDLVAEVEMRDKDSAEWLVPYVAALEARDG